jgi:hypothetical protein
MVFITSICIGVVGAFLFGLWFLGNAFFDPEYLYQVLSKIYKLWRIMIWPFADGQPARTVFGLLAALLGAIVCYSGGYWLGKRKKQ